MLIAGFALKFASAIRGEADAIDDRVEIHAEKRSAGGGEEIAERAPRSRWPC